MAAIISAQSGDFVRIRRCGRSIGAAPFAASIDWTKLRSRTDGLRTCLCGAALSSSVAERRQIRRRSVSDDRANVMTGGETTAVAGIEIPRLILPADFRCIPLPCATGAIAMLSEKRRGRHSKFGTIYFWCLLHCSVVHSSPMRWPKLSLVHS
jgi:hypothetical protein